MVTSSKSALRIFVSHSSNDHAFGTQIVEDLRQVIGDDTAVWYDSAGGLIGGDIWWEKIIEELTVRDVFIVILSPTTSEVVLTTTSNTTNKPLKILTMHLL